AREFDSRFEKLLLTGRVTKWYSEVGNEATTVPAGLVLQPGDVLCTLHRDLGAILATYLDPARTFPGFGFGEPDGLRPDPEELLYRLACQLLGKADGFSQGIERSFHYGYLDPDRGIRHVGMISHLGAMIPVAAGCAFARRQDGTDRVAINFIGDGGTSTGDFHEGLNLAAVWNLPLVLVVENNRYAFSTPTDLQFACERLSDRGPGYGIHAGTVDGNDPDAMAEALEEAVLRARLGEGPTLIEAMLGRMRGHSEGDDSLKVVPEEELERYLEEDPVPAYAERLERDGTLRAEVREPLEDRISELVEEAIQGALDSEPADPRTALRGVFASVEESGEISGTAKAPVSGEPVTYVEGIHQALVEEMERDESVIVMGQDVAVFEGAFRATRGLHDRWPDRVFDTPIAESGTLGVAEGAAILGYRPVVEIQFADFVTCGFNQIVNVAGKLYYRWQVSCPIVVRLPGGGGVGAGPFHSQNVEGWFAHAGGLKVVCPATARDAKELLRASIRDPNPVIFCEHKYLYRRIKEVLPKGGPVESLGRAAVRRKGRDLTFVTYGSSLWSCLEVADELSEEGVECEVVDLRTLVPLDEETVLKSVRKTHRVLVVHEALLTGGYGGEVVARISDAGFPWLDAPIRRVAYPDRPSPYVKSLERRLLPGKDEIHRVSREVLAW
ncbi:MAG: dehydrogenase E1 component subunit alpha/beta, partial [Thermoanaerobaculia bacterium]|nr:dehydrogenase E1 component subunit alpha/beta [Thermoanaerobaculia bacterium]